MNEGEEGVGVWIGSKVAISYITESLIVGL